MEIDVEIISKRTFWMYCLLYKDIVYGNINIYIYWYWYLLIDNC